MFTKKGADASANERNLHGHQRHHRYMARFSAESNLLSLKGIWVAMVCLLSHGTGSRESGSGTGSRDVRSSAGQEVS